MMEEKQESIEWSVDRLEELRWQRLIDPLIMMAEMRLSRPIPAEPQEGLPFRIADAVVQWVLLVAMMLCFVAMFVGFAICGYKMWTVIEPIIKNL